jgi:Flp pilus assembly pilin Flp
MRKVLGRFLKDERAQDLAEYGIALAVIATGAGALAIAFADNVNVVWSAANTAIQDATDIIAGS